MASYSSSKHPLTSESLQFTYNKKPFKSRDKALDALKSKNLLPGEPAVAYYIDEKNKLRSVLAIGTLHDSNNTLIIEDSETILKNASISGGGSGQYDDFIEKLINNASSALLDENLNDNLKVLSENASTWVKTSEDVDGLLDESKIQNTSINLLEKASHEEHEVDGGDVEL